MSNIFTRLVDCVRGARSDQLSIPELLAGKGRSERQVKAAPIEKSLPLLTKVTGGLGEYAPPLQDWCDDCGKRVKPEYMRHLFKGTTILFKDGKVGLPHFETVFYCRDCMPPAVIRFVLRDTSGEVLDDLLYRVSDGWMQLVDEVGDECWVVSPYEYDHTFCTNCGELIEETTCQGCRKAPDA